MGINRPTNLNIRDVPGNGSIVGPSTSPSLGISTTVCCSCYNSVGACAPSFDATVLGCQCTFCACPCCDVVCSCDCTVCDRTIPSGMWKTSEQYEAKERDAWGDDTGSSAGETCLCSINSGYICKGPCNAPTGGYIINVASNVAWIVAPTSTEVSRCWYCWPDAITVAQNITGCTGWFIPSWTQLTNPGYSCRIYWDRYSHYYWSSTAFTLANRGIHFITGTCNPYNACSNLCVKCIRTFRCVTY